MQAATAWAALERELERWPDGQATLWWRDDDATAWTAALDRLLALAAQVDVPLALAVIPGALETSLAERLADRTGVTILQHGYVHVNHQAAGKKIELGPGRDPAAVALELQAGARRLQAFFPSRRFAGLVPPWNRIAPALVPRLPALGFTLLSCHGPRPALEAAPGLIQANTHVDPVDWRGSRATLPEAAVLDQMTRHLSARRPDC
jgi:hypothetical protein